MRNANNEEDIEQKKILITHIMDISNKLSQAFKKTKDLKKNRNCNRLGFKNNFFGKSGEELEDLKKKISFYKTGVVKFKSQISSITKLQK